MQKLRLCTLPKIWRNSFVFAICNPMQSVSISLGPCGSLSITAKFDSGSDLKMFESRSKSVFDEIKTSFDFIQTNYSGVYIYTFEAENAATEITLN